MLTWYLNFLIVLFFRWTGSNTNPPNNDGQGLQRTDRTNLVLQASAVYPEGTGKAYVGTRKYGHWGRSYPEVLDNVTFLGLSRDDLVRLAVLEPRKYNRVLYSIMFTMVQLLERLSLYTLRLQDLIPVLCVFTGCFPIDKNNFHLLI